MTIRKTLLIAFLLVGVPPAALLTALAFITAGEGMRDQIGRGLHVQAATVADAIDKMLFERVQNAETWRRLEVMQEIQVGDVDKRLAKFLADVQRGYGDVYRELACVDAGQRIVASSVPGRIGQHRAALAEGLAATPEVRLGNLSLHADTHLDVLPIGSAIPRQFDSDRSDAEPVGQLLLLFNWNQVYRLLDQAAQGGRMVMLVDGNRRIIAASAELRRQGLLLRALPPAWTFSSAEGVRSLDGAPLGLPQLTAGFDHAASFRHFEAFGWTTVVMQPSRLALVPVQHMAAVFLILLAATSLFAIFLSYQVAARIARPITALTGFTRHFMREQALPPLPAPSAGEVGELTHAFVQTVQDLERSRHDLVRASKLALLGELAATLAHEVRTPLGILRSSAQMLAREPQLGAEARELIGFIESETERLNKLVSTLLDSARPRMPNRHMHDLHALIRHALDLLGGQAGKKQIRLVADLQAANPMAACDEEQWTQVLLNLVLNAIQVLQVGGEVTVRTRDDADALQIAVSDNGPGIPPEERPNVFDTFFSRREGGIGLGLAIVQQIVAAHQGSIRVEESDSGGARFVLRLPRNPMESA